MREGSSKPRPWSGPIDRDTGERVEEPQCWAEVYDPAGRLLGLLVRPTVDFVEEWARSRPVGSRYRVVTRGGGVALARLEIRVHPGRLVEITGSKTGGGKR